MKQFISRLVSTGNLYFLIILISLLFVIHMQHRSIKSNDCVEKCIVIQQADGYSSIICDSGAYDGVPKDQVDSILLHIIYKTSVNN
jgi:hypothetical protein